MFGVFGNKLKLMSVGSPGDQVQLAAMLLTASTSAFEGTTILNADVDRANKVVIIQILRDHQHHGHVAWCDGARGGGNDKGYN